MENIENSFNDKISNGKCVVDFYAEWCGPCKMFSPIFEAVKGETKNINFYKFNVDLGEDVCKTYGIMSIPTIILFENGKEIKRKNGLMSKDELKFFLGE